MSDEKMMGSVGRMGLAIMVSRVLGLIRDQVFAFFFGGGLLMDCFQIAFRIPNLLRDLFAEGALSTAFVTVFAQRRAKEGDSGAWDLARLVMTLQVALLSGIVFLGIIFAPQIVGLIAPGFAASPGKTELTVNLTRVMFPFILFVGMAALSMGVLNAFGRFGLPASASSFFNLGSILGGLGLAFLFDRTFGNKAMVCMAVGTLIGGFLQWFVQTPALRSLGYIFRPNWNTHDPGLRQILRLMAPTIVGLSAVQVNVVVNSIFASELETGSVAWLAYAFRLIQLPIGLFGVAISTVALPALAVKAAKGDTENFRNHLERALRLNAALCIPAACGLAILSQPLVSILFQHGKFNHYVAEKTAHVLCAYTVGLLGYSLIKVLASAFYALNKTLVPMCVSLGSIVVTILLNWFFVRVLKVGAVGLAWTTSLSALLSSAVLFALLRNKVGGLSDVGWKALGQMVLSSLAMSAAVFVALWIFHQLGVRDGFWGNLGRVFFGIGAGVLTYGLVAMKLNIEEVTTAWENIQRRLGIFFRQD